MSDPAPGVGKTALHEVLSTTASTHFEEAERRREELRKAKIDVTKPVYNVAIEVTEHVLRFVNGRTLAERDQHALTGWLADIGVRWTTSDVHRALRWRYRSHRRQLAFVRDTAYQAGYRAGHRAAKRERRDAAIAAHNAGADQ